LVYRSLDDVTYQWSPKQAAEIFIEGTKTFGTPFASISTFDNEHERFKAELGYDQASVSRTISIAAHALLADDAFVVLDTKKVCVIIHFN
jgi:phenylalanine-4-hydroxylase